MKVKQTAGRDSLGEFAPKLAELNKGDAVTIPAGVKHWHGAAKNSWFSHIAVGVPGENASTEWCGPVTGEEYDKL